MTSPILSQRTLKELLHYDPDTGVFTWKVRGKGISKIGSVAGYIRGGRYRYIKIRQTMYAAHNLAWLYFHGSFPSEQVDHINRNEDDNRISNLRAVTRSENCRNRKRPSTNTSGVVGVQWNKAKKRWYADAYNDGKRIHLGSFISKEDAIKARKYAEKEFSYHPNHGV